MMYMAKSNSQLWSEFWAILLGMIAFAAWFSIAVLSPA
jgi:hypothetical protein